MTVIMTVIPKCIQVCACTQPHLPPQNQHQTVYTQRRMPCALQNNNDAVPVVHPLSHHCPIPSLHAPKPKPDQHANVQPRVCQHAHYCACGLPTARMTPWAIPTSFPTPPPLPHLPLLCQPKSMVTRFSHVTHIISVYLKNTNIYNHLFFKSILLLIKLLPIFHDP